MTTTRPTTASDRVLTADLSLDLDNLWAYLRTHGDASWERLPTYLPLVVPKLLAMLDGLQLKLTIFVVGQDTVVAENHDSLAALAAAGHELANHSFSHQPWLQRFTRDQLRQELDATERGLLQFTERPPVGFRAPGYSLTADVLELLVERGYRYDCSTLPSFLGPLSRSYYLLRNSFSRAERAERADMLGSWQEGLRSLRPYYWQTDHGQMLELPVTTMPWLRSPFHFSYLNFVAQFSPLLARRYLGTALALCRLHGIAPSLLLHPLDFLGADDVPQMSFFPGMKRTGEQKREFVRRALASIQSRFRIEPLAMRADRIVTSGVQLPLVTTLPHRRQPS